MIALWDVVTIAQALIVAAAVAVLWLLVRLGENVVDARRMRRGLPPLGGWDHCEHCKLVERLAEAGPPPCPCNTEWCASGKTARGADRAANEEVRG